jgi:hypothetical protein
MVQKMMKYLILACVLTVPILQAQQPKTKTEFDEARRSIERTHSYQPPNGFVSDQKTATAIAYAVAVPVYGKTQIDSELPLHGELKDGKWLVLGTLSNQLVGGTVIVEIDQKTGKILYLLHGK